MTLRIFDPRKIQALDSEMAIIKDNLGSRFTKKSDNSIKKVIFNGPATIVWFGDGEKVVVKCRDDEEFDYEKGLAMAVVKKLYSRNQFLKALENAIEQDEDTDYQPARWHLFGLDAFPINLGGMKND